MSSTGDTLLAFLVGATIGGVAALLLAPEKGEKTRKKLKKQFKNLQKAGEGMYDDTEKAIEEKAAELVKLAQSQVGAVKSALENGKETYIKQSKSA